jgi:hypothetical protein
MVGFRAQVAQPRSRRWCGVYVGYPSRILGATCGNQRHNHAGAFPTPVVGKIKRQGDAFRYLFGVAKTESDDRCRRQM